MGVVQARDSEPELHGVKEEEHELQTSQDHHGFKEHQSEQPSDEEEQHQQGESNPDTDPSFTLKPISIY